MQLVACFLFYLVESYATLHAGEGLGVFLVIINGEVKDGS